MARFIISLLTLSMVSYVYGYVILKQKAYVQLNDADGNKKINSSTLNSLAFDYTTNFLYVIAHEPARLTVLSLAVDGTPTIVTEHKFSTALEGYPLDVEICRPTGTVGDTPRVAISFQDPASRSAEGRVVFYQPLTFDYQDLREIQRTTVGSFPLDLEFAADCAMLVVSNKGQATKEGNLFRDPEGSLTKIQLPSGFSETSPIVSSTITFSDLFFDEAGQKYFESLLQDNFRTFPIRDPTNKILSIAQNIEPEDVVVSENGNTAYVTLPLNNAIARVNLFTNQVSEIFALGNRSWTDYYMDASDMDGGVNMQGFNILSLYQARKIRFINQMNREWLVTLDSGLLNINHEYSFLDFESGKKLQQAGIFDTKDPILESQLADDKLLGRLAVSKVDGVRPDGRIDNVFTFGGRGFSIHSTRDMGIRAATVDSVEKVTQQYFPDVFNTAYRSPTSNPQRDSESTSPFMGPYLQAMDIGDFQNKHVLFLGGGFSGIIYVYVLSPDARCPQPYFHSAFRAGGRFSSWQTLYDSGLMGDIGITEMRYLHDIDLSPVLVVTSGISNSVSVYSIEEGPFNADSL